MYVIIYEPMCQSTYVFLCQFVSHVSLFMYLSINQSLCHYVLVYVLCVNVSYMSVCISLYVSIRYYVLCLCLYVTMSNVLVCISVSLSVYICNTCVGMSVLVFVLVSLSTVLFLLIFLCLSVCLRPV